MIFSVFVVIKCISHVQRRGEDFKWKKSVAFMAVLKITVSVTDNTLLLRRLILRSYVHNSIKICLWFKRLGQGLCGYLPPKSFLLKLCTYTLNVKNELFCESLVYFQKFEIMLGLWVSFWSLFVLSLGDAEMILFNSRFLHCG